MLSFPNSVQLSRLLLFSPEEDRSSFFSSRQKYKYQKYTNYMLCGTQEQKASLLFRLSSNKGKTRVFKNQINWKKPAKGIVWSTIYAVSNQKVAKHTLWRFVHQGHKATYKSQSYKTRHCKYLLNIIITFKPLSWTSPCFVTLEDSKILVNKSVVIQYEI